MDPELYCNGCYLEFKPGDRAVATACTHIYCFDCTKRILTTDAACFVCNSVVTKQTIKAINTLTDPNDTSLKMLLLGQHPAAALNAALANVEHYTQQHHLYAQRKIQQLEQRNAKMADQCKQKLNQIHHAYTAAKRKYEEVHAQKAMLEADNRELQEKYSQKAMEAKKLRENVQILMASKDELERSFGRRPGGPAPPITSTARRPGSQYDNHPQNNNSTAMRGSGGPQYAGDAYGGGGGGFALQQNKSGQQQHRPSLGGAGHAMNQPQQPIYRSRTHPDPSPIHSPAYDPNSLRFDFATPVGQPVGPRHPQPYSGSGRPPSAVGGVMRPSSRQHVSPHVPGNSGGGGFSSLSHGGLSGFGAGF